MFAVPGPRHGPCSVPCTRAARRRTCPDQGQPYGTGARWQGVATMKHAACRELYAYWDERRGKRPAPERAEIEPGAIRHVLSDALILGLDAGTGHPFRLAGTRMCALFGRELKNE